MNEEEYQKYLEIHDRVWEEGQALQKAVRKMVKEYKDTVGYMFSEIGIKPPEVEYDWRHYGFCYEPESKMEKYLKIRELRDYHQQESDLQKEKEAAIMDGTYDPYAYGI